MSSNDEVIILKGKKGQFEVHHHHCVENDFIPDKESLLAKRKTLVAAIKYAQKFCNEWPYVEYGYSIGDSALK